MSDLELPKLEEITTQGALNLSNAQFQGMTIQALKDMREDMRDIKRSREVRDYINYFIAGVIGLVAGVIGGVHHP